MSLKKIGESGLLKLLTAGWSTDGSIIESVGDDCAVLKSVGAKSLLVFKTDCVVEGVHFYPRTKGSLVGRKAMARTLSDIAAMGAVPWAALITLGVPKNGSLAYIREVYKGLSATAKKHKVNLVGGETTQSRDLFLSVAMVGMIKGKPVLRRGARHGDEIWVTGKLGRSMPLRHLTFEPRMKEGQWLARNKIARAMMDISDGLAADLPRMAEASRLDFYLDEKKLPRFSGASVTQALNDGEDYELVFAVNPRDSVRLRRQWPFSTQITCIGHFTKKRHGFKNKKISYGGFDHFKKR